MVLSFTKNPTAFDLRRVVAWSECEWVGLTGWDDLAERAEGEMPKFSSCDFSLVSSGV
jgi:hypothetical protein